MQYRANPLKLDNRFLLYAFQERDLQGQIKAFGSGSTVEHMRVPDCEKLTLRLPPLPVQQKIASILSAYDDLIENNTRRIQILEEMAQMLYQERFVNFRFPGHEQAKFVESELGPIPEGWGVKKLGDVAQDVRRSVKPETLDPETPYFGLEHLPRRSITLSDWGRAGDIASTKLLFKRGEILFGKIRPYFHKVGGAPLDGICSSDTIVIQAKSSEYFPLVLACVSSEQFVNHATQTSQGTKMPRANWKILVDCPACIPPQNLLSQFNQLIEAVVAQTQNLMFKNTAFLYLARYTSSPMHKDLRPLFVLHWTENRYKNLSKTRDLLLSKLISGEIDIESFEAKAMLAA